MSLFQWKKLFHKLFQGLTLASKGHWMFPLEWHLPTWLHLLLSHGLSACLIWFTIKDPHMKTSADSQLLKYVKREDAQKLGCQGDSVRVDDRTWESPCLLFCCSQRAALPPHQAVPPYRGCLAGLVIEFQENLDTEILLLAAVTPRLGQDSLFSSS